MQCQIIVSVISMKEFIVGIEPATWLIVYVIVSYVVAIIIFIFIGEDKAGEIQCRSDLNLDILPVIFAPILGLGIPFVILMFIFKFIEKALLYLRNKRIEYKLLIRVNTWIKYKRKLRQRRKLEEEKFEQLLRDRGFY